MTTRLTDVIQQEVFTDYVIHRSTEKSALIQSGIVENNAEFDQLASGPYTLVNMPFVFCIFIATLVCFVLSSNIFVKITKPLCNPYLYLKKLYLVMGNNKSGESIQ